MHNETFFHDSDLMLNECLWTKKRSRQRAFMSSHFLAYEIAITTFMVLLTNSCNDEQGCFFYIFYFTSSASFWNFHYKSLFRFRFSFPRFAENAFVETIRQLFYVSIILLFIKKCDGLHNWFTFCSERFFVSYFRLD